MRFASVVSSKPINNVRSYSTLPFAWALLLVDWLATVDFASTGGAAMHNHTGRYIVNHSSSIAPSGRFLIR